MIPQRSLFLKAWRVRMATHQLTFGVFGKLLIIFVHNKCSAIKMVTENTPIHLINQISTIIPTRFSSDTTRC